MARETRGPVPVGETDLRRFSLNPLHWRQARRMLAGQAVVTMFCGVAGLFAVHFDTSHGNGVAAGLDMTPGLSWMLVVVGLGALGATLHRRLAIVFSALLATASMIMVIVTAVAATHHAPGPLGLTAGATVLFAVIFCTNLAIGMWLIPNHIEGPTWLRVTQRSRDDDGASSSRRP